MQRMMGIRRTYSPWVTVPPGTIGDLRNRPPHQPYNRCARHMGYEMHPIARQTDAPDHLKEIDRFQIRIVDSALRHGSVGTIPESSVSTVDSLDTCRPTVHDRTRPYRSNLWVGNSNMIKLLGAPRGMQNWDKTPVIPHEPHRRAP